MGINSAELQQKVNQLISNADEAIRGLTKLATDDNPVKIQIYDKNGNLITHNVETIPMQQKKVDSFIQGARGEFPAPDNLILNSFMIDIENGKPKGYSYIGIEIEAVHPFTKGFEGPYTAEKPLNAVDNPEYATKSNPYWYGVYNKGPRISRGGLADGWGGISNGHILKITAPDIRDKSDDETPSWRTLWFSQRKLAHTQHIGFRCWVKIVKGSGIAMGVDAGLNHGRVLPNFISKEITEQAPQGWYLIDKIIRTSDVVNPLGSNFALGFPRDEIEVYIALPYAYIPFGQKNIVE